MKTVASFLLAFLPALTFAFFLPFPMYTTKTKTNADVTLADITPDDVCPFIQYIDNELCSNESRMVNYPTKEVVKNTIFLHYHNQKFDPTQLCPLFS